MSESALEFKVVKLENSYNNLVELQKDLKKEQSEMYELTQRLNTNLALLEQSLRELSIQIQARKQIGERLSMFAIGGLIAAVVSWIVRGGLGT
jgi:hypothetical protein